MSDMMQGGPPAPQPGGDMRSKMSVLNPTDMAAKVTKGDVRPNQTVGEFLQRNFGVSPQDPVEKLFQSVKGQVKNATMAGKMGVQPPSQPSAPPQPGQAPIGGMDDLVKRI